MSTFSTALRGERRRLGLTQKELAAKLETSQQNITAWELGKAIPRQETLDAMVKLFGKHSVIAALPAKGEIPGGDEILRANQAIYRADVSARNAVPPAPPAPSAYAQAIVTLFDALPEDHVTRATAFAQVTAILINAGRAPATPDELDHAPSPGKQHARRHA